MSKLMRQAFKDLKGVWPASDSVDNYLWQGVNSGRYIAFEDKPTSLAWYYIGTREEFEACRKEKWYLMTKNREIPAGAKRVRLNNGHISEVTGEGWYMSNDQLAYPMAYTYE